MEYDRALPYRTGNDRGRRVGPEAGASGATPRVSRRKTAEFNVPIKLWVSQEVYDTLEAVARGGVGDAR